MIDQEEGINIRSEEVNEILGTPPSWLVRWGSTMVFAIVVALGWIGYLIKYPDTVIADIKVTASDPPKRIIAENSLIISKVWVNNEDTVKSGQTLISFNTKGNFDDIVLLEQYMLNVEEINDSTLLAFNPPRRLILGDIQENLHQFFEQQEKLRRIDDKQYDNLNVRQLRNQLTVLQNGINSDRKQLRNLEEEYAIVNRRYATQEKGVRERVLSQTLLDQTREKLLNLERERQGLEASIKNQQFQIQNIRSRINGEQRGNKENRQAAYEELVQSFDALKSKLDAWKKSYTISSPIAGIVLINNDNISDNQYVTKDQLLMQVIPFAKGDIIGKIDLELSGSGKVEEDQEVIVKFASYPFQEFGAVIGRVSWKGSIPSNNSIPIKVEFPKGLITTTGKRIKPNQEMIGTAEIVTADKRFIERIFERFRRNFS